MPAEAKYELLSTGPSNVNLTSAKTTSIGLLLPQTGFRQLMFFICLLCAVIYIPLLYSFVSFHQGTKYLILFLFQFILVNLLVILHVMTLLKHGMGLLVLDYLAWHVPELQPIILWLCFKFNTCFRDLTSSYVRWELSVECHFTSFFIYVASVKKFTKT